jgi:hypothetical protein
MTHSFMNQAGIVVSSSIGLVDGSTAGDSTATMAGGASLAGAGLSPADFPFERAKPARFRKLDQAGISNVVFEDSKRPQRAISRYENPHYDATLKRYRVLDEAARKPRANPPSK